MLQLEEQLQDAADRGDALEKEKKKLKQDLEELSAT